MSGKRWRRIWKDDCDEPSINGLPPIHPGEYIKEILQETGVSQSAFAKNLGVSPMRITHIIHGRRPVTAELAFLIGKATGQSPEYWLNLQMDYDLKITRQTVKRKLKNIQPMAGASPVDLNHP